VSYHVGSPFRQGGMLSCVDSKLCSISDVVFGQGA
jgi:hypothetical protein